MTIGLSLTLLMLAAEAVALPSSPPAAPCRLLTEQARSGEEVFVTCPAGTIRLDPRRSYVLIWNPTLRQTAIIGRGKRDDLVFLVSNDSDGRILLEDLTVEITRVVVEAQEKRSVQGLHVVDATAFATNGRLRLAGVENDPPPNTAPLEWQVQLAGSTASEQALLDRAAPETSQASQRVAIIR